jgi:hypothetical protein
LLSIENIKEISQLALKNIDTIVSDASEKQVLSQVFKPEQIISTPTLGGNANWNCIADNAQNVDGRKKLIKEVLKYTTTYAPLVEPQVGFCLSVQEPKKVHYIPLSFSGPLDKKGHLYFRATGHTFFLNLCADPQWKIGGKNILVACHNSVGRDKKLVYIVGAFCSDTHGVASELMSSGGIEKGSFAVSQTINWHTSSESFSDYHLAYDFSANMRVVTLEFCGPSRFYSQELLQFKASSEDLPVHLSSISVAVDRNPVSFDNIRLIKDIDASLQLVAPVPPVSSKYTEIMQGPKV